MERRTVSTALLTLLSLGALAMTLSTQPAKAQGIIYIRADGTVDPPTAPIMRNLNIYTFTDNIYEEIVIERSDVIVDGAGYNLSAPAFYNGYGLSWSGIDNATIQNINIQEYFCGVYMYSSSFNSVTGNNITNCGIGVIIDPFSSNNTVSRNHIEDFGWCAMDLYCSSSTTVFGNIITGDREHSGDGVCPDSSSFNVISGNNITNCKNYGVAVYDSSRNIISGNNVTYNFRGIYLGSSSYNTISDNIAMDCNYSGYYFSSGIFLESSSNNTVSDNNVTDCNNGVCLLSSSNNLVYRNIIENASEHGIGLFESSDNATVSENNIRNCSFGVTLESSSKNVLRNNIIVDNKYGFGVSGHQTLSQFVNDVDLSNSVDGKPVYYLINQTNLVIDPSTYPDIGYLALINSTNITVKGLELKSNTQGLLLANTTNSIVTSNNITDNYAGIDLYSSSNNTIYHNNFIENTVQIRSDGYPNALDAGYPLGGNYWSDYTGLDLYKGPFQNLTGSDGLGDKPRMFNLNDQDRYPLMTLWNSWKEPADSSPPLISTVQRNPASPNYDEGVVVSATVTDNVEVDQVFLFHKEVNDEWHSISMNRFGDIYNAAIGPQPYGPLVQYRIYANDTNDIWSASELYSYSVIDDVKPELSASRNPLQPRANQIVKYVANVFEPINASGVKTVTFHYRVNNGSWLSTDMTFNPQWSLWEISIVGQQAHALVEYYVTAQDNAGNENSTVTFSYTVALAGDANLDHTVNVLDAGAVSAHWYPGPPIGPLGYDSAYDLDFDGQINVIDAAIVSSEWNQIW